MKLVTFVQNGTTRIGALISHSGEERVVDFSQADPSLPKDMIAFLQGGNLPIRQHNRRLTRPLKVCRYQQLNFSHRSHAPARSFVSA